MSDFVKGKLSVKRIGSKLFIMDDKGFSVTKVRYSKKAEANAKEIVRRWNAFEDGGLVDELRTACEVGLDAINALLKIDIKSNFKNEKSLKELIEFVEAALVKS